MRRFIVAIAAALCVSAPAFGRSLFGCDFSDCSSVMPTIGSGSTSTNTAYSTGSDGAVGVNSTYRAITYDYTLETFIEPAFQNPTWRDISCTLVADRCNMDTVKIRGNKNDVVWTWTLDANMVQNSDGGLRWYGSDWGTRFPDRDAAMRPPNNDSKQRCKDNCDLIQKSETNLCSLRGSEIGMASWVAAQAGAVYFGTKAGVVAGSATAGIGAIPAGLLVYKQGADILVPVADQATTKWTNLCTARANDRWTYCVTVTCAGLLWLLALAVPASWVRRRAAQLRDAWPREGKEA